MAKVIIHTTLTLDGFMARPNDDIDWAFKFSADETVREIMSEIGAVIMGNSSTITEDTLPYDGQIKVPQFVVTHHPRDPITIGGLTFTYLNSIERAVEQAKKAAREKNVMLLGASIDQQCLNAGLVDEIMVHLAPILIGEGIRLFDHLHASDIKLERIAAVTSGEITSLRFRVIK
ncbi:MAG: dihydrofolate reductase family protein [Anaerolineaceae bacterium]|nr:dihydrofolate reductase family protein [Anaerolineaceae bacterium]